MTSQDLRALEKCRERVVAEIDDLIVHRDRPSQLLLAARDAARQATVATAMARTSTGGAQVEWISIAAAYADVASSLTRLSWMTGLNTIRDGIRRALDLGTDEGRELARKFQEARSVTRYTRALWLPALVEKLERLERTAK